MAKVYENPPVIEALCEIRFDPKSPWDVTIFGHYYDRVSGEFSDKRQMPELEVSLTRRQGGMRGEMRKTGTRMQFVRPDGTAMVQLAPHLLVVNQLSPYETWQAFKQLVVDRLIDYEEVAGPLALMQIGLRYINRFDFPMKGFSVASAFGPSDLLPARLRQATLPFFLRLEIPQNGGERLLLTMGTAESEQVDQVSVVLDLDYRVPIGTRLDAATLTERLDRAHDRIEEAFESCLTEQLRNRFDAEG